MLTSTPNGGGEPPLADVAMETTRNLLVKAPTGIQGFDEITGGGLPQGRPTLVCGGAGSGKTLFGMEFLVRGALEHGEPGVFVSFEENAGELVTNAASLGFDLGDLVDRKLLTIDHVRVERSEIEETGEYDLEGLFIRLGYAVGAIGAKRIVLDTLEALFASLPNEGILRAELRRLFHWLKERRLTAVVTAEQGDGTLTRRGLEEYVSDCVIMLDQRVSEQVSTRRLRVLKYRGSSHGTNEYPFLIHARGISVLPITSLGLQHQALHERMSTGVPRLDGMLGGEGLFRGSSMLISGTAGAGKTSLAAHVVAAACARGERCLTFAFEESESQLTRNMRSIGVDLGAWVKDGRLRVHASRPTLFGLEMHLATMHAEIEAHAPRVVVVDPITHLQDIGNETEVRAMLTRLVDYLKGRGITAVFTSLTAGGNHEQAAAGISSLMDTWILLTIIEGDGERNRGLYVLKSRGMAHSNQVREFVLTGEGIELLDVYAGASGVLTGAARRAQEARERADVLARRQEIERKRRALERRRALLAAQMAAMRAEFEAEEDELRRVLADEEAHAEELVRDRRDMARHRLADADGAAGDGGEA